MLERAEIKQYSIYIDHDIAFDNSCSCGYCHNIIGTMLTENPIRASKTPGLHTRYYSRKDWEKYNLKNFDSEKSIKLEPDPPQIARWAIQNYTDPGQIVLDPFMGLGTTIVEAINNKRQGIGFELNRQVFSVASENIELNIRQGASGTCKIHNCPAQRLWSLKTHPKLIYTVLPTRHDKTPVHESLSQDLCHLDKFDPESYWEVLTGLLDQMSSILDHNGTIAISLQDVIYPNGDHETISDLISTSGGLHYIGQVYTPLSQINTQSGKLEDFYRTFVWRKL